MIIDGEITNAAMVLLGKSSSEILFDFPPKIMWRLHSSKGELLDSQIFTIPFILAVDAAYKKVRNLTYKYMPSQISLFPTETQQYDTWTLRELINNCIAHQDYELGMRIYIDELEDHLIISNAGKFLPGSIKPVLDPACAPPYYKNPLLDNTMVNFRMIETASSGIRRVYSIQQKKLFPLPDYDLTEYNKVKVKIYGRVLDEKYTQLLFKNPNMDLETVFLLDKVQKHEKISKIDAAKLRKRKLIEGRVPNLYIAASVAESLGQKAEYVKNKGFTEKYYQDLIIKYLTQWKKEKKSDFIRLLKDKLPDSLTAHQKDIKVKYYLQTLRREGKIITQPTPSGKKVEFGF
ncbi:ATP-binding protein [Lactobacillus ultunensis]|uniref:ATP-binding protein n=1 Tax=Lactobacillus ultunensis TaxID=227945 RepID=UPI000695B48A|nr:ATP-binding protein [Lactobacillus ultunensis]QQP28296.1 transcriptional regulator [Lactobacillus ultunensis]